MLSIGPLKLKNWLVMAPMAGVTGPAFRLLVKRRGAGLVTTEMISAMGLKMGQRRTVDYLRSDPEEGPLAVQIFGSDPLVMAAAAERAIASGADVLDINMGCPARKVTKTGAGGALLQSPGKIRQIVSAVRRVCSVPLSVKIRAGWSPQELEAPELARMIEDHGADALTIHPRFVSEGFSGSADWAVISKVKDSVRIPVIGNGDVFEPSHAFRMKEETGCDGVMIGRAAVWNPWIFRQILDLERGLPAREPSLGDRKGLILEHFELLSRFMGESRAARAMRGHLLRYTKGLAHSCRFRESITRITDIETLMTVMDEYFSMLEENAV